MFVLETVILAEMNTSHAPNHALMSCFVDTPVKIIAPNFAI